MVPRARQNGLDVSRCAVHSYVAAHTWCRALECRRASVFPRTRAAAPLSMLPHSYTCCREPMVPRAAECHVVLACGAASHAAAQLYVVPRSSTCCRVPCCLAVLHAAASHGAAQFSVLPRPMVPRSSMCCRVPCCRAKFYVRPLLGP